MKIGLKLTLSFFVIALLSMAVIGIIAYNKARKSLAEESFNRLTAVREMKASQIEDYFKQISDQLLTLSEDPATIEAMKEFKKGFNNVATDMQIGDAEMTVVNKKVDQYFEREYLPRLNKNLTKKSSLEKESTKDRNARILQYLYIVNNPNPVNEKHKFDNANKNCTYNNFHINYHPIIKNYLEKFGYYDIFLVDNETGNIVYTAYKEVDFGTSLINGPFRETNLAMSFRAAQSNPYKNYVKLVDYEPYHASYNQHASFIATSIFDGNDKIGVLIFQMPIDKINDIMTSKQAWSKVGLGTSGETYIVGEDFTLRNQSRFLIEDSINYFQMIKDIGLSQETIEKIKNFSSSIGLQEVKTDGTIAALGGETDAKIFPDYRGVPVLSAYKPLKIEGVRWAIMSELDEAEAFAYIYQLRNGIIVGFLVLLILISIASYFISRELTKPLKILTYDAMELAKGNLTVEIGINKRKDEIGILALSFKKMQISISNLVTDLKDINHNLENKVNERTSEINKQKEILEDRNKEILDSIKYAKRLQSAILPPAELIQKSFNDCFILFKPKDIVSGDFYWLGKADKEILVAAVDCTGHGVPGAMVSVVGANNLDRCIKEFGLKKPADVLDKLSNLVTETFETTDDNVQDGMDISLCNINFKTNKLQYSGANNPVWIVRKTNDLTELIELKPDKQPIGKYEFRKPFTNNEFELIKGDCIYLFSDGYADQFGGPNGKKFKYKTLKDLLMSVHDKNMAAQKEELDNTFESWKGMLDQIDDVCVIGIRV
jgi:serine phosphatase RsbU (regulator of sigma subunit)